MEKIKRCEDCGVDMTIRAWGRYCSRCLANWYIEKDIPDHIPSGDFDEPRNTHSHEEY